MNTPSSALIPEFFQPSPLAATPLRQAITAACRLPETDALKGVLDGAFRRNERASTFHFDFGTLIVKPAADPPPAPIHELPVSPLRTGIEHAMQKHDEERRGLRILVVDDNHDVASTTSMLLELVGHRTDTAHNGRDAIVAATRDRYDVVLLDLNMPVMDGFKAAGILGQLQPAPKLIALSACDGPEARQRTTALGFCAHLTKPVSLDLLQATLGRHCRFQCPPSEFCSS